MTPKISPTSLRELADSHDPYWRADTRHALRAAADRLEAYECLQVSTRKELDAAKARIEGLERDEGIVMVGDGLRCGPEKVTCLLLERDELRKELDAAKAAHAEESGRWDEQHAHQHAVNTKQAKELVAAKAELEISEGALESAVERQVANMPTELQEELARSTKILLKNAQLTVELSEAKANLQVDEHLRRQNAKMRDALVWYATDINWLRYDGMDAKLMRDDRGYRARAALNGDET